MNYFKIDDVQQELVGPNGEIINLRPQSLEVFRVLLNHSDTIVSKDFIFKEVWGNSIVTEDSIVQCIADIRRGLGDEYRIMLQTVPKKGYRLVTETTTLHLANTLLTDTESETQTPDHKDSSAIELKKNPDTADELSDSQKIRFCATDDGVRIAYSTLGNGPPVIFVANWLTHLKYDLRFPARRALVEMLMPNFTVVRYDSRGNGLSDLEVEDIALEASVLDLEAIVSDLGFERFSLIGQSQGAAIAALYAARNSEKVDKLVVYGGYARGRRRRGSKGQIAESDAFVTMIREGWGRDIDAYVQMFGTFFMPDATKDQLAGFTKFQRIATPPENAARIQSAIDNFDISNELPNIRAPCLVLHVREDARVLFEEGLQMAASIPNAQFVPLEGRNHALLAGEPALQQYLSEIQNFLVN